MEAFDDVRRWAAVRAAGVTRFLLQMEGHLVDVEGAVDAEDPELAATFARPLVMDAMSIVSLGAGGALDHRDLDLNFDWFENVDTAFVDRGIRLAIEPITEGEDWRSAEWLIKIRSFLDEVEQALNLDEPLPRLRSSEGMFAGLAAARSWIEFCGQLGVPTAAITPE